jgi:AcrR family transcriptional regulator
MPTRRKAPANTPAIAGTAQRILAAARGLFEREGAQAVSMRRIADAIGLTPMAIYRHFPNREALLKRISDDSFDEIAKHWLARNQGGDALSRVIALQRIYLDYALAYPHLFDHAFSTRRADARKYPGDFHFGFRSGRGSRSDARRVAAQGRRMGRRDDALGAYARARRAVSRGSLQLRRSGIPAIL